MKTIIRKKVAIAEARAVQVYAVTQAKWNQFTREERGDAAGWAIGLFVSAVLLIGVYVLFKEQLASLIASIFSKITAIN